MCLDYLCSCSRHKSFSLVLACVIFAETAVAFSPGCKRGLDFKVKLNMYHILVEEMDDMDCCEHETRDWYAGMMKIRCMCT
jgi:hypothetical protein